MIKPQISQVVTEYIKNNRKRLSYATLELTKYAFRLFIESVGDIAVDAADYSAAEKYRTFMLDSGRSKVTANMMTKSARPVFRWAIRRGYTEVDPFEQLKLLRPPQQRIRVFEKWEFKGMMENADLLWKARLLLAKTAGLRRGEVLNLTLGDVDFHRKIIYVQPKKEGISTWRWNAKDMEVRALPLCEHAEKALICLMDKMSEGQPYPCLPPGRYKHLMMLKRTDSLSERLRCIPDENFARPFKRILKRAGINSGTFHDLRRTCITEWLENGLQPHEVQRLAGHSSVETTMNYYTAIRSSLLERARAASQESIGATGLEPATS